MWLRYGSNMPVAEPEDWYEVDDQQIRLYLLAYDRAVHVREEALSRSQRKRADRITDANASAWFLRLAGDERAVIDIAQPPLDPDSVWVVKGFADVAERAARNPFAVSRYEIYNLARMTGLSFPRRLAACGGRLFDPDLCDRGRRGLAWLAACWEGKPLAAGPERTWPGWLEAFTAGELFVPTDAEASPGPGLHRTG